MPIILLGGFFANQSAMPMWLMSVSHLSPISMANQAINFAHWGDDHYIIEYQGFDKTYWGAVCQLALTAVILNITSAIFLKLLVDRFQ